MVCDKHNLTIGYFCSTVQITQTHGENANFQAVNKTQTSLP